MEKLIEKGNATILEWFKKHMDKDYAKTVDKIVEKNRNNLSLR